MKNDIAAVVEEPLVSASELDKRKLLAKGTAYKMAKLGLLPAYRVGCKKRGVKFRVSEVLVALRGTLANDKQITR